MSRRGRPTTGAQRRAAARARTERAARRRRRLVGAGKVLGLFAGAGVVAAAAFGLWHVAHRPRPVGSLPAETPLSSYRVVYHVSSPNTPESDEEHDVQRPFFGRYVTRQGAAVVSGSITNDQGTWLYVSGTGPGWASVATPKARAAGDSHVAAGLGEALRQKLARVMGHDRVIGHECTVVRTGSPVGSPVTKPTAADHADICVDSSGVMLREIWTIRGKLARNRTATTYDTQPAFTADTWSPTPATTSGAGLASAAPHIEDLSAADVAKLAFSLKPPAGYTEAGAFSEIETSGGVSSGQTVEHFVNGPDLIDLMQGAFTSATPPAKGRIVNIGRGTQATVEAGLDTVTVEVREPTGAYARLTGSDVAVLLSTAAQLHHT